MRVRQPRCENAQREGGCRGVVANPAHACIKWIRSTTLGAPDFPNFTGGFAGGTRPPCTVRGSTPADESDLQA